MHRDVSEYVSLLERFLANEVPSTEFQARFLGMFKREDRELEPELFSVLDTLYGDVDALVVDPDLRAELESQHPGFYLDEEALRRKVRVAYEKLARRVEP